MEEFESFTKTNPLVIIHFWAEWNPYDIVAKDVLGELDNEYKGRIAFASIDTDQEHLWDFMRNLGVKGVPAFSYFKNEEQLVVEVGLRTKEGFQQRIDRFLAISSQDLKAETRA